MDLLGHSPEHVEAVLVAADRLREAYEAMIEGRDVGWLPAWQPSRDHFEGAVSLLHRALPYLRDWDEELGGEGPGLLVRAIEAEFPTNPGGR